jgi:hypothetical protein
MIKQFLAEKLAEFEKNYLVSAGGIETVFAIESYSWEKFKKVLLGK